MLIISHLKQKSAIEKLQSTCHINLRIFSKRKEPGHLNRFVNSLTLIRFFTPNLPVEKLGWTCLFQPLIQPPKKGALPEDAVLWL